MRYNLISRTKQYFNYYKYNHILFYYQKSIKYKAYSNFYKISECYKNKGQKYLLYNSTHIL